MEADLDKFMAMNNKKNLDLDAELDALMDEDDELKQMKNKPNKKRNLEDLDDSI